MDKPYLMTNSPSNTEILKVSTRTNSNTEIVETGSIPTPCSGNSYFIEIDNLRNDTTNTDTTVIDPDRAVDSENSPSTVEIEYILTFTPRNETGTHPTDNSNTVLDSIPHSHTDSSDTSFIDGGELDEPVPIAKHVRFQINEDDELSDWKNANTTTKKLTEKPPGYKGRKFNHKSFHLCTCHHCYVLNVPSLFHEVKMDVAAISHDAKPGDETFDLPEIPMRFGRKAVNDNYMNNNELSEDDENTNSEDNKFWTLYDGLDNFVEEWRINLRGFNCWNSICTYIYSGIRWTFRKLYGVWKVATTCRKVAPYQGSRTVSTVTLEDDEFNGNDIFLRRANSCDF